MGANSILCMLARVAAVLLWAPGVGVPVTNDNMLSPYELMVLAATPVIFVTSFALNRLVFWGISVGVCALGVVFSLSPSESIIYFLYYMFIMVPSMLLFLQILEDPRAAEEFLRTFVRTGVWLSPLALIQLLSPFEISLINNVNYSLQSGVHRAWAFAPEASILAALYVVSICVALFDMLRNPAARPIGGPVTMAALVAGVLATKSTSAIAILPPLVLFILRVRGVAWARLWKFMLLGALLIVAFYFLSYRGRIESGDSTSSTLVRLASIVGGMQAFVTNWVTGLGLGMNKSVADAAKLLYLGWTGVVEEKPGIDSFQLSMMVEMGILPGLFSIAALVTCYRYLRRQSRQAPDVWELVAVFSIALWFESLLTSGYRGLAHCWLYFPAGYVLFRRGRATKQASRPAPTPDLVLQGH